MDNNNEQNENKLQESDVCVYQINFNQEEEINLKQQVQVLQNQVNQLQAENAKLNSLNLKLYERLASIDQELITQHKHQQELITKIKQDSQVILDLKMLVQQQRDFIEEVNNDQAYSDLTEELEISLQKILNLEKENDKLQQNNQNIKTKYEESLTYIKDSNIQWTYQNNRIQELEKSLFELQQQLSNL